MKLLSGIAIAATLCAAGSASVSRAQDAASGEKTFKAKCTACHGADGKGKEALKTQDLASAAVQNMSDAELTSITANGKGKMPAYKGKLTDDQIKDLVAYIRSLAKK
jgi:cytochrome c6